MRALKEISCEAKQAHMISLTMYANEPCRICGEILTPNDIWSGAVWAGYSKDNKSRAAHKDCWDRNLPKEQWCFSE